MYDEEEAPEWKTGMTRSSEMCENQTWKTWKRKVNEMQDEEIKENLEKEKEEQKRCNKEKEEPDLHGMDHF